MKVGWAGRAVATVLATGAVLAVLLPTPASAARKRVAPARLVESVQPTSNAARAPYFVGSILGPCYYHYPLKLPAGTVITGLSYLHGGASAGAHTIVGIDRVRPGADPPLQRIYEGESSQVTGAIFPSVKVVGALQPNAKRKVARGWDYFLAVEVDTPGLILWGAVGTITVSYR